jgi:hypothetical protein
VKPSRVSAVAALVFLAPDLQEEILGLQATHRLDALGLADLLRLARLPSWEDQRTALALLARSSTKTPRAIGAKKAGVLTNGGVIRPTEPRT